MEQTWVEALENKIKVEVDIRPVYSNSSTRPDKFIIKYKIGGKLKIKEISNK